MKNIVLIGFMGAGKSVVGKKLATLLKKNLVSTDVLIVEKEKRAIADIFKDSGEPYFRGVEKSIVENISKKDNLIVDCGGGVVLNPDNMSNLKKNGVVFYLQARPDIIYERVKGEKHRPLLNVADPKAKIQELLEARKTRYEQADHIIDTSAKNLDQVVDEILTYISYDRT